jgi:hypothetical protein
MSRCGSRRTAGQYSATLDVIIVVNFSTRTMFNTTSAEVDWAIMEDEGRSMLRNETSLPVMGRKGCIMDGCARLVDSTISALEVTGEQAKPLNLSTHFYAAGCRVAQG